MYDGVDDFFLFAEDGVVGPSCQKIYAKAGQCDVRKDRKAGLTAVKEVRSPGGL